MVCLNRIDIESIITYAQKKGYHLKLEVINNAIDGDSIYLCLNRGTFTILQRSFNEDSLRGIICIPAYLMSIVKDVIRHAERRPSLGITKTCPSIERVLFNDPATIIFWSDGTKTVVKAQNNEPFDPEKGLAVAISKKFLGNKGNFNNVFKKFLSEYEDKEETNG